MSSCKSCGDQRPSSIRKAVNFSKAAIKHIANGLEHTSKEVQEKRRSFCLQCPFIDPVSPVLICTHEKCGCYIDSKVIWASEECPIGLWGKYIDDKDLDKNNVVNTPQS